MSKEPTPEQEALQEFFLRSLRQRLQEVDVVYQYDLANAERFQKRAPILMNFLHYTTTFINTMMSLSLLVFVTFFIMRLWDLAFGYPNDIVNKGFVVAGISFWICFLATSHVRWAFNQFIRLYFKVTIDITYDNRGYSVNVLSPVRNAYELLHLRTKLLLAKGNTSQYLTHLSKLLKIIEPRARFVQTLIDLSSHLGQLLFWGYITFAYVTLLSLMVPEPSFHQSLTALLITFTAYWIAGLLHQQLDKVLFKYFAGWVAWFNSSLKEGEDDIP